ncbi:hypothetical protein JT359_14600 [Candidatus Poribacteria bacterium]|nr:hypothetical protein [Candidatus Poribacteria bacterium]
MIRDIFVNKWIIFTISLLIFVSTVYIFLYRHQTAQYRDESAESALIIQRWQSRKSAKNSNKIADETNDTTTSTTTNVEVLRTLVSKKDSESVLNIYELPDKTQERIIDEFYTRLNLKPPPFGYDYLWKDIDVPELDDMGNPILHKIGDPIIELEMGEAFTPTLEEYEMIKVYEAEIGWQTLQGETAKAAELKQQRDELYEQCLRIRPKLSSILWVVPSAERKADPNKGRRLAKKALINKLIEEGYTYLIPILEETGELN